ncbi:helix-turn-helix domain-containing protein [Pseudescherichia sp.]|uniref:helix-turn-helix domain-containing protein n=1 Tax=Pseudescherichia sp. TaxID=2055881 RepID=UPI00289894D1|nr:helix-turn-helix domain-containing protein [Pseudescherichia sp.]
MASINFNMLFISIFKQTVYNVDMKEETIKDSALSDRLTKILKAKKMSKSELARQVGVSPQAVNNWFTRGELGRESAQRIADALKVSIDWLLKGDPDDILTVEQIRLNRFKHYFAAGLPDSDSLTEKQILQDIHDGKQIITDSIARRIEADYSLPYGALDYDPLYTPSNPLESLSEQEVELLHLFRQMPKSAQREMLAMFNSRVSEYAALFAEMLETKKAK